MFKDRKPLYAELEKARNTKLIVYVTGDRKGLETQVHPEVLDLMVHHLDTMGAVPKLSLLLHTMGGHTLAAWSIVNLLRQFCDKLEIIVPSKARSAGTLMCLGADTIVMTKQATLGPIDPSVNSPLNPILQNGPPGARVPVSVESINGYMEFVKQNTDKDLAGMPQVIANLSAQVHPIVLGNAYRSRAQIRMLAGRLLAHQVNDKATIKKVLDFLCSDSGSHDYTIFRREAKDELGLNIEKPDDAGYALLKSIYDDIVAELELASPYDPNTILGKQKSASYAFRRGLVESTDGGSHVHCTEGTINQVQVQVAPGILSPGAQDQRTFEGWRHES